MSDFKWRENWTGISYFEIGDSEYKLPENLRMIYASVFCVCAKCTKDSLAEVFEVTADQLYRIFVDPNKDTMIAETLYNEFIVYHPGDGLVHCDTIDEAIEKMEDYE